MTSRFGLLTNEYYGKTIVEFQELYSFSTYDTVGSGLPRMVRNQPPSF